MKRAMNKEGIFLLCIITIIILSAVIFNRTHGIKKKSLITSDNIYPQMLIKSKNENIYILDENNTLYYVEKEDMENSVINTQKIKEKIVLSVMRLDDSIVLLLEDSNVYIIDGDMEIYGDFNPKLFFETEDAVKIQIGKNFILMLSKENTVNIYKIKTENLKKSIIEEENMYFEEILFQSKIIDIVAEGEISFALDDKGDVWAWGNSRYGALGLGDEEFHMEPEKINIPEKILKICTDGYNCIALSENGKVYSWGEKTGAIGNKYLVGFDTTKPNIIEALSNIVYISLERGTAIAIDEEGKMYYWGICFKPNGIKKEIKEYYEPRVLVKKDTKQGFPFYEGIVVVYDSGEVKLLK